MPKLYDFYGYSVYFWSNEGNPIEPIHVHISKEPHKNATKVWILENGDCKLDSNNDNIPYKDLKRLLSAIESHSDIIKQKWIEYYKEIKYFDSGLNLQ